MIEVEAVFREWNYWIMGSLQLRFPTTPRATLEDGAAFAWAQFATKPPPDEYAIAWLKLVARREVLRLLSRWEQPIEGRPDHRHSDSLDSQLEARELLRQVDD